MSIALKFTSLFIRTLAKPIATRIKTHARDHPTFRNRCIYAAQAIHRAEATLRMRVLNESEKKIRPLNDARAIQTGANFVAESFVFSVAASLILYESWRSRRKEQKRHETVSDDIRMLQDEIMWIKEKLEQGLIIKKGEEMPLPPGLKPAVLKILEENNKKAVTTSANTGHEVHKNQVKVTDGSKEVQKDSLKATSEPARAEKGEVKITDGSDKA